MGSLIKSESTSSIKTEMGNLKISEPTTTDADSSSDNTHCLTPATITSVPSLNSLISPTGLSIPSLKFEDNSGDVDIQSPDYSLWESIFTDNPDNDFMMCSPVRNMLSPGNAGGYGYGYPHLVGASPPRFSSPLNPNKGKGMSPLHRVFNSPNNQFMQVEQVESLSLPALESFLGESYDKEEDFVVFSPMKVSGGGEGSADLYAGLAAVPELLDCLTMAEDSTRFIDQEAHVAQENGIYHPVVPPPLSQQLQQERQQEERLQRHLERRHQIETPHAPPHRLQRQQPPPQQQLHQQIPNMHNTLMVPMPEPEQVIHFLMLITSIN